MIHVVVSAGDDIVVERATPAFEPGEQSLPRGLSNLELARSLGLLLDHNRAVSDMTGMIRTRTQFGFLTMSISLRWEDLWCRPSLAYKRTEQITPMLTVLLP